MNQIVTKAIVLTRTSYQEADRIITLLTPDHGKVVALAKGVRKSKSKMAAGTELFSVAEVSFLRGRGEVATLTSARLIKHFGNIVKDMDRTMLGYDLMKWLHRATEDQTEVDYFEMLQAGLEALDENIMTADLIKLWFEAQLLRLAGHQPNLRTDTTGKVLDPHVHFTFSLESMAFEPEVGGRYEAAHIKLLRLAFSDQAMALLNQVQGIKKLVAPCLGLVETMLPQYIRV